MDNFLLGVLASLSAAALWSPIAIVQRTINVRVLAIWKFIFSKNKTMSGKWIARYSIPKKTGTSEERIENISAFQDGEGVVRGSIANSKADINYTFIGELSGKNFVGHYVNKSDDSDVGTLQLKVDGRYKQLIGKVSLYDSTEKAMMYNIDYLWFRLPNILIQKLIPVRADVSGINDTGLFSNRYFVKGSTIGNILLGHETDQGMHTLKIGGCNYLVKKPWLYMNHSCDPNAEIQYSSNSATVIAIKSIMPQTEILIDYNRLQEDISEPFTCNCQKCDHDASSIIIGGASHEIA